VSPQQQKSKDEKYKDHTIEIYKRDQTDQLFIDNMPMKHAKLPDGSYFLRKYAYDPADNLMDLARKFIDYQSRVDKIRQEGKLQKRGLK
jgi:hypothetical protein